MWLEFLPNILRGTIHVLEYIKKKCGFAGSM